jgi:hypothetical protein
MGEMLHGAYFTHLFYRIKEALFFGRQIGYRRQGKNISFKYLGAIPIYITNDAKKDARGY